MRCATSHMHTPFAPLALAIHLTLGGLLATASLPLLAQQQSQSYNIPAGALGESLNLFARQAGVAISFDAAQVRGLSSPGLQGSVDVATGFARLLGSSPLQAVAGADGYLLIARPTQQGAVQLGATQVTGAGLGASSATEGTGSYTSGKVTIGKLPASIRQTPQSVTVITRQQMDDRNLTSLDQVLDTATGITLQTRNFGDHQYNSRGFELGADAYMIDGLPGVLHSPTGWMTPDTAVYDHVEVLRGAAGLLVGNGNPGGAINLERKRPTAEAKYSVTTRVGSNDYYRMDLDASGPLNDTKSVRGRALVAYEDRDYFYDTASSRMPLFYGIVEADLNERTMLTVGARHQTNTTSGYAIFGLPHYSDGRSLDVSRSTSLAQDWNRHESDQTEVFAELEYRLNDDWKSRTSLTRAEGGFDQRVALARGAINPVTGRGSSYTGLMFRNDEVTNTGFDSNLSGNFQAFGLQHDVIVGANWSKEELYSKNYTRNISVPLDVFNPNSHLIATPARPDWQAANSAAGNETRAINDSEQYRYGVYANTRLRLTEALSLVLGGRLSWYEYQTRDAYDYAADGQTFASRQDHQFTPFAGVVYDLNEQWSWYASYADIFQPQSQYREYQGGPLEPAKGTNYETGIKGELYDGRLNVSAAVFYIKRRNMVQEDLNEDHFGCGGDVYGTCYTTDEGIQRSKGYELEASGEILPGWQMAAGYTFNRTQRSDGEAIDYQTPRHLLRASTSYNLPGALNRLTVGGAVSAQSGYETDDYGPTVSNSGRAVYDAMAKWKIDDTWNLGLDVKNLFDRKYYKSVGELRRGSYYGDPRTYMLTLRADF